MSALADMKGSSLANINYVKTRSKGENEKMVPRNLLVVANENNAIWIPPSNLRRHTRFEIHLRRIFGFAVLQVDEWIFLR